MDDGRRSELWTACRKLIIYNLWKRGKVEEDPVTARELCDALDAACGAIYEYIENAAKYEIDATSLRCLESAHCELEKEFDTQVAITKDLMERLWNERREVTRLRCILAANHLPYKKRRA